VEVRLEAVIALGRVRNTDPEPVTARAMSNVEQAAAFALSM
jgi:hypothetical protein